MFTVFYPIGLDFEHGPGSKLEHLFWFFQCGVIQGYLTFHRPLFLMFHLKHYLNNISNIGPCIYILCISIHTYVYIYIYICIHIYICIYIYIIYTYFVNPCVFLFKPFCFSPQRCRWGELSPPRLWQEQQQHHRHHLQGGSQKVITT